MKTKWRCPECPGDYLKVELGHTEGIALSVHYPGSVPRCAVLSPKDVKQLRKALKKLLKELGNDSTSSMD